MMRLLIVGCWILAFVMQALGQNSVKVDSSTIPAGILSVVDTFPVPIDSVAAITADSITIPISNLKQEPDTSLQHFQAANPWFRHDGLWLYRTEKPFKAPVKDTSFYLLGSLFLFLGIIRVGFSKYFSDILRIFSQTRFRQKSIREQILQNRLASLLFNLFFCISGGIFLFYLAGYKGWLKGGIWWNQALICIGLLIGVYLVKFTGLRLSGWLFGMREEAEAYSFMVFLINKVVGVLLLPTTLVLALGSASLKPVFLVISLLGLCILFFYRYIAALPLIRQHTSISRFHFFLYLCAFEIVPVLLIYKLLLTFLNR